MWNNASNTNDGGIDWNNGSGKYLAISSKLKMHIPLLYASLY